MFKKMLVAARGEIALRIIRCCREMNIIPVVVYSTAEKDSLPTLLAPESVCIGPGMASESYLREDVIIEAALKTGCEAVHPGYGFLSENPAFARACRQQGLAFIGPSAEVIEKMGDKQQARRLMIEKGVPVVPGSAGLVKNADQAVEEAGRVGYPVMLKASAGGGGKGMREAHSDEDLGKAYETAAAEAKKAFGNGDMYLEKLIRNPRHIEFQILADAYGNIVHLGERDCSIQKKHQKLLEEAPAWGISAELREKMGRAAVAAASAAAYNSAGTIEFILDETGNFYFIEMNTRIQVEHPVTEMVTGIDLIREQIRIAAGCKMTLRQEDIHFRGHAIECRINAEGTGKAEFVHLPGGFGVRTESHLYTGYQVSPYYDSMLAKVIAYGESRLEAIRRMRRALEELVIEGLPTNDEFMYLLTYHPAFIRGEYSTSFWEEHGQEIGNWQEEANGSS